MPNNGCTRNAKKSRRNVNPWGNLETVSSASTPTKSPGPWTKSWGPKRGSVGPGRQRRDEIRFGLKEGQAAGAASSAGRPPHISGPILANLPIFGSTWPACFVTGRAKDACFPPRWLGNGQQGTARWPTTTPVLTARLSGSHRAPGTRCTDWAAPTGTSKSRDIPPSRRCQTRPFTKIQKTAIAPRLFIADSVPPPGIPFAFIFSGSRACWLLRYHRPIFLPSAPCTCAVQTHCSPIGGSLSLHGTTPSPKFLPPPSRHLQPIATDSSSPGSLTRKARLADIRLTNKRHAGKEPTVLGE